MTITISENFFHRDYFGREFMTYDAPVFTTFFFNPPNETFAGSTELFAYQDSVSPPGGGSLTIRGLNFGYDDLTASMHVGETSCYTLSWSSQTTLSCLAPKARAHPPVPPHTRTCTHVLSNAHTHALMHPPTHTHTRTNRSRNIWTCVDVATQAGQRRLRPRKHRHI